MAVDYRGRTALVTGASSGIGLEFAKQLAQRGSNFILVARREERLLKIAQELKDAYTSRAAQAGFFAAVFDLRHGGQRACAIWTKAKWMGHGEDGLFICYYIYSCLRT